MLDEVGLPVPEHPNGEGNMKHPGEANQSEQPPVVR